MELFISKIVCFFLPFLTLCNRSDGTSIHYSNCGPADSIRNVDMAPCPQEPCVFHRGTNATVTIAFSTPNRIVTKVNTNVYGVIAGIPVPYSLPNENGCVGCNLACPLKANSDYTYINVFPVLKTYPAIRVLVKWTLVDENGDDLVCFVFPMEIQ